MTLTISCYVDRLLAGPSLHSLLISWLWAWPTMIINMLITAPDTQAFTECCLWTRHVVSYLIPMTTLWSGLGNLRLIRGCWWVAGVECRLLQAARSAGLETSGSKAEQHPVSASKVLAWLSSPHHSLLGLELWLAPASGRKISFIGQRNGKVFSCLSALESKVLVEPMVTWWRGSGRKEGSLWSLFSLFGWEVILTNRIYGSSVSWGQREKEKKEEIFLAWRMMSWAWRQARYEICISQSVCATQPESFLCWELAGSSENKWNMCMVRPLGGHWTEYSVTYGSVKTFLNSSCGFLTCLKKHSYFPGWTWSGPWLPPWRLTTPSHSSLPAIWPLSTCAYLGAFVTAVPALKTPIPDVFGIFLSFSSQSSLTPNLK